MIQEFQLRLIPRAASSHSEIARQLAKQHDIDANSIQGIRILKRSIDARQRVVMVNLKVRVYIDEPMTQDYLVPPIEYRPVDSKRQAIVVGMGPGGLFAALRLIELGIKPIVLERGKNVVERRKDASMIQREGIIVLARVGQELIAMANSTPAARSAVRWSAFLGFLSSMALERTS